MKTISLPQSTPTTTTHTYTHNYQGLFSSFAARCVICCCLRKKALINFFLHWINECFFSAGFYTQVGASRCCTSLSLWSFRQSRRICNYLQWLSSCCLWLLFQSSAKVTWTDCEEIRLFLLRSERTQCCSFSPNQWIFPTKITFV